MQHENELTIELLKQAGECLYGDQWQSNLARKLDLDSRRIRQWLSKDRPLPDWLVDELIKLLEENAKSSESMKKTLEELKK